MRIRPQTKVTYEIEILVMDNGNGRKCIEEFSINYDTEMYEDNMDNFDNIFINERMKEYKDKYRHFMLTDFSVWRDEILLN